MRTISPDSKRSPVLSIKKPPVGGLFGRSDWTRTSDLCVPNAAFYQAELHFDNDHMFITKKIYDNIFFN